MRKYKITFYHYDKKSQELEAIGTRITKSITENTLSNIILTELIQYPFAIWKVSPRPKNFGEHFK